MLVPCTVQAPDKHAQVKPKSIALRTQPNVDWGIKSGFRGSHAYPCAHVLDGTDTCTWIRWQKKKKRISNDAQWGKETEKQWNKQSAATKSRKDLRARFCLVYVFPVPQIALKHLWVSSKYKYHLSKVKGIHRVALSGWSSVTDTSRAYDQIWELTNFQSAGGPGWLPELQHQINSGFRTMTMAWNLIF